MQPWGASSILCKCQQSSTSALSEATQTRPLFEKHHVCVYCRLGEVMAGKDRGDRGPSGKQFFVSQEAAGRIEVSSQRVSPVSSTGHVRQLPALSRLCASQWLTPTLSPTMLPAFWPLHQLRQSQLHLRYPTAEQLHSLSTAMVLLADQGCPAGSTKVLQAIEFQQAADHVSAVSNPAAACHICCRHVSCRRRRERRRT